MSRVSDPSLSLFSFVSVSVSSSLLSVVVTLEKTESVENPVAHGRPLMGTKVMIYRRSISSIESMRADLMRRGKYWR
jgi:hypothetical protein